MHNTLDCHHYDSTGKPLVAAAVKSSESKKPYKKFGGNKSMSFVQTMFKGNEKARRLVSPTSIRGVTVTPVAIPTVDRKLGAMT
jgi:hypothetical protein